MQRIAAGQRQTLTRDHGILQIGDDAVFVCLRKWLAGIQPPGAFVIAAAAFVDAAGNEQYAACSRPVHDINRVILMEVQSINPAGRYPDV